MHGSGVRITTHRTRRTPTANAKQAVATLEAPYGAPKVVTTIVETYEKACGVSCAVEAKRSFHPTYSQGPTEDRPVVNGTSRTAETTEDGRDGPTVGRSNRQAIPISKARSRTRSTGTGTTPAEMEEVHIDGMETTTSVGHGAAIMVMHRKVNARLRAVRTEIRAIETTVKDRIEGPSPRVCDAQRPTVLSKHGLGPSSINTTVLS